MAAGVLGIDAGGSSTRWRLLGADGRARGQGRVGPLSGHLYEEASRRAAEAVLDELAAAVKRLGHPRRVVAGVTGLSSGGEPARWLAHALAGRLALPPDRVRVYDDMEVAYRAAFEPGEGVLVYGGTGSIAVHLRAAGAALRAGGHGYLLDDDGGGFSIGRAALRRVLRETDRLGEAPGTALGEALAAVIGGHDWDTVRRYVYGGGRSAVAALAPAVARAAEAGDVSALAVLAWAGRELARLADVLLARVDAELPVALAGGVTYLGPALQDGFRAALPAAVTVRVVAEEPVDAAARLALAQS